jgi:signal transduction histidine kinase
MTAAALRVIAAMTGSSLRRTPVRFRDDARTGGVGYRRNVPPIRSLPSALSRAAALDGVLAGALAVLAVAEVASGQVSGPRGAAVPLALALALPLAVRRRFPLPVTAAVSASFLLNWAAGVDMYSYWASIVVALIIAYTAAAHLRPRPAAVALACLYAAVAVSSLHGPSNLLWGALLIGGAAMAGFALRDRRRHISQLAGLARQLELARDENARAAVAGERARIARELHDVVAHSVSVMVVQAGAAQEVLGADPGRAREPLRSVQDTGRQALVELRRLLGVLRTDDGEAALAPQPGLDQLGALAAHVRDAGVAIELCVDGARDGIPAGVDLAAYRIVQEALTNVLKHASAAHAVVRVGYRSGVIELEVLDDGHGPLGVPGTGSTGMGQGLIGMRERAWLYGGALEAGPRDGGGFAVRARLPVRSAG